MLVPLFYLIVHWYSRNRCVILLTNRYPVVYARLNGNKQISPQFSKIGSRLDPGNYRPVSLTSIVCKILEKIIIEVIVDFLTTNNLINSR